MRHDFSDNPIVTIISKPVGKVFILSSGKTQKHRQCLGGRCSPSFDAVQLSCYSTHSTAQETPWLWSPLQLVKENQISAPTNLSPSLEKIPREKITCSEFQSPFFESNRDSNTRLNQATFWKVPGLATVSLLGREKPCCYFSPISYKTSGNHAEFPGRQNKMQSELPTDDLLLPPFVDLSISVSSLLAACISFNWKP